MKTSGAAIRVRQAVLLAGFLVAGFRPAGAAAIFVATNGNDVAGDGSFAAPYRTLNHALQQAVSGDVVEARSGAYRENAEVRFRNPGVTLRSAPGERATIEAPLDDEDGYSSCVLIDPDADGTILSRLDIAGGYYYGIMLQTKWDWGDPEDREGACRVTIEDCTVRDTGRDAIKITPNCDDVLIQRCEIFNTGVGPANETARNAEGIDCVNGDRVTVRECAIHDVYSTGIYLKGGATDGLVERTRVERCGGGGILLGFDTSPEYFDLEANPGYYENIRGAVRNCLVRDTAWEGIGMYAASNPAVFNNTLVNVCTDNVHAALYFGLSYQDWDESAGRPPSVAPEIFNNLVLQPEGFADEMLEIRSEEDLGGMRALAGWPVMDRNGYSIAGGGTARFTDRRPESPLEGGTLAQWRAHAGADAGSFTVPPLVLGGPHPALLVGSPGIDAGVSATWMAGATDLAGNPRIQGAAVDVGAYEAGTNDWPELLIGHAAAGGATNPPPALAAKVGQLRWFFTHASVGGNLVTGLNVLHAEDPARFSLRIHGYDGDDGDGAYHGAVGTAGSEGGADYRAVAEPASASNGFVYECMRGNPDWRNKLVCFSNSVVQSGWRFPKVNVVMDKFCWIDPAADPAEYCAMMADLEGRFPQTLFVYLTMPLTTETAGSENDRRNDFNRYVRAYCRTAGKWLLDLADLEAWTEAGAEQTYVSGGTTNQRMATAYAVGPEWGDYHLNAAGRRQAALGWYALGGALFATDRDGDGMSDGDELISGTAPADGRDRLQLAFDPATGPAQQVVRWAGASNRWYALQESPTLAEGAAWSNRVVNLPATDAVNVHTLAMPGARSFLRLTVAQ